MEENCNVYTLIAVNAPIMGMVYLWKMGQEDQVKLERDPYEFLKAKILIDSIFRKERHIKLFWYQIWPRLQYFGITTWLEANKCAFTFLSEIRQIQCMRTEFWCLQCPRPAGPSALDKHQIHARALDFSYFMSKSKCKFINLIHTQQKNKIICSCSWQIINKMALKCH